MALHVHIVVSCMRGLPSVTANWYGPTVLRGEYGRDIGKRGCCEENSRPRYSCGGTRWRGR
jgi:hypothetical protein